MGSYMDKKYQLKPAFISFLITYLGCFGIAFLLIAFSSKISREFIRPVVAELGLPAANPVANLPYGVIFSLPFLAYGLRTFLWNLMSRYEISPSEITLLRGSLVRKESFFPVSGFCDVSFKQNLFEAPLGIGKITLKTERGSKLVLKGVENVKSLVEALRTSINSSDARGTGYTQPRRVSPSEISSKKHNGAWGWSIALLAAVVIVLPVLLTVVFKIDVLTPLWKFIGQILPD
jgi:membrane protein YdbS with pleckstrin-like domain